jgi:predicted dehydrogenase
MLKIGIIGCGKIADQHADHIKYLDGCSIVAACDNEILMARQFCERYRVPGCYTDIQQMFAAAVPDVIHITTPPQSHFPLARVGLEAGCHVYVEKPFTLNLADARALIELARARKRKLTVGHNAQFSHAALRMRAKVAAGYLGGPPVHIESYYCYNFADARYAKALLGDKRHWVRALPGRLLHNIISHGIAKIAEFLTSDVPHVIAHGFTSPLLKSIGEEEITDELRVIISDPVGPTTAYFTFSSQLKPALHQVRLYGPERSLIMDDDHQIMVNGSPGAYKSYMNHFVPPLKMAAAYGANSIHNIKAFFKRDLHNDAGMRHLISQFYKAIRKDGSLPIPYAQILRTTAIMDDIFRQIGPSRYQATLPGAPVAEEYPAMPQAEQEAYNL